MPRSKYLNNKLNLISNFIETDIYKFSRDKYGAEYSHILENNISKDLDDTLNTCRHHRDKRTNLEYAQDLILGWIIEDYIFDIIREDHPQLSIRKSGADAHRKILAGGSIKSTSDFRIAWQLKLAYVELISDYTGFWKNNEICHLRDEKLAYLKATSRNLDTYILALDIRDKEFQFIKVDSSMQSRYIRQHFPFGKKPAYEISIDPKKFDTINNFSNFFYQWMDQ